MRLQRYGRLLGGAAVVAATLALLGGKAMAATELTVYTAVEAEDLKKYAERFNVDHPDIKINWVRDSTGIVTAKLLAEKNNPQADLIWGLAATSLLLFKGEGMLEPYAPKGLEKLDAKFRDAANPPSWVGMDAWVAAICFNTVEGEKNKLPLPTSWKDLLNPVYKGHVIMPNPSSSGTGFLDVSSWLQLFGEDEGWKYMDGLHENIGRYTHSGSKPCKLAASGETAIGISFAFRGAKSKAEGAPLEIIIPSEGIGWDMEATAIMNGTDNPDAAKKLADFAASAAANQLYAKSYSVTAHPDISGMIENYPANEEQLMIKNDFAWAAGNRERIIREWRKRYDAKTER
ncbi:MAG: putative 2-aminoethylphosphonate ABC transporter substrate-binding protein [Pseudomonadota bacterium]